jgi:hypothetical protein
MVRPESGTHGPRAVRKHFKKKWKHARKKLEAQRWSNTNIVVQALCIEIYLSGFVIGGIEKRLRRKNAGMTGLNHTCIGNDDKQGVGNCSGLSAC